MVKAKIKDSRSRNGTPISTDMSDSMQGVQSTSPVAEAKPSYNDLLDKFCRGKEPPASAHLQKIHEALLICREIAKENSEQCDKGMRETSSNRKEAVELARQHEIEEARAEAERKSREKEEDDEASSRPMAVGGRSLAPQDGADAEPTARLKAELSEERETQPAAGSRPQSSSSMESHQPRPAPPVPQVQTFGEDPSVFDDPTIYHIRDLHDGQPESDKKEILGVSEYPPDDLHDLTPGTPPDRDFSAGKSSNQVTWQQFTNYLELYTRPLTQEDLAFLEERGDRTGPFVMPRRGGRDYHAVWAEEDGQVPPMQGPQASANQPSGSMDQMTDDAAERGDVSTGPVLARLLGAMIPERRAPPADQNANADGDGDGPVVNGTAPVAVPDVNGEPKPHPPATQLSDSNSSSWRASSQRLEYAQMDQKILAELRHIGFIQEGAEPDYEGHHDDEVAARLRYLQEELQRVSILNGARKARIMELAEEEMAKQEWSQITDDLDSQLNQAYLKRHRNIGKGKKMLKRPGGPGGGQTVAVGSGVGKPGVGEQIRGLMDRRSEWSQLLGPIVDYGHRDIANNTIFDEESMKRLMAREQELWTEAQDA